MPRWDANVGILQGGAHSSDQAEISLENTTPVFAQTFPGCAAAGNMLKCILWDSLCFFPLHSIPSLQWVCMWVHLVPSCSALEDAEYMIAALGTCLLGATSGSKLGYEGTQNTTMSPRWSWGCRAQQHVFMHVCRDSMGWGICCVRSLPSGSGIVESQNGMGWREYRR